MLLVAAVVMGHVYESYMTVGSGEVLRNLFRAGQTWQWALLGNAVALLLVFRPVYARLEYRKVQLYDFLVAITAMIVLNLAVWTLGAELLYPDKHIKELDDLPRLLSGVLGEGGRWLFYLGIFAAIYTSVLGHAASDPCSATAGGRTP